MKLPNSKQTKTSSCSGIYHRLKCPPPAHILNPWSPTWGTILRAVEPLEGRALAAETRSHRLGPLQVLPTMVLACILCFPVSYSVRNPSHLLPPPGAIPVVPFQPRWTGKFQKLSVRGFVILIQRKKKKMYSPGFRLTQLYSTPAPSQLNRVTSVKVSPAPSLSYMPIFSGNTPQTPVLNTF